MKTKEISGDLSIQLSDNKLAKIIQATVLCKAQSLKSENSTMDSKAYDALKATANPAITFTSVSVDPIVQKSSMFTGKATGTLCIAGKTNSISVDFQAIQNKDNSLSISGSFPLTMSSYGMVPPTAVFGTIKTGDALKLAFTLVFIPHP